MSDKKVIQKLRYLKLSLKHQTQQFLDNVKYKVKAYYT